MTSLRDAIISRFQAAPSPGRRSSPGTTPETTLEITRDPLPRRGDQDLNPDMAPRLPLQAAAVCLARALTRGIYLATPAAGDLVPAWREKWRR